MGKNDLLEFIGKRLMTVIETVHMTIDDFSCLTGIKPERMKNIINAKGRAITASEVKQISDRTFLSADYILGLTDEPLSEYVSIEDINELREELEKVIKSKKEQSI